MSGEIIIVGLGEALWDLLPAGKQLGGAPLNVACHAQQLLKGQGGVGVVASRVGNDALGDEIVQHLHFRGMTADFVQRDSDHPTSTVRVELKSGQPQYEFAPDIAWDHLEFTDEWADLARSATAVTFGTLAQRSPSSREAIWRFLEAAPQATRLLDVNLRSPFYDRTTVAESCRRATIVKLGDQELPVLAALLDLPAGSPVYQAAQLRARYELDAVVYTRGQRGTMIVLEDKVISPPAVSFPAAEHADSVGAGDACSAAILVGWSLGFPPLQTAALANHLGAYVASQPGATPQLPPAIVAHFDPSR